MKRVIDIFHKLAVGTAEALPSGPRSSFAVRLPFSSCPSPPCFPRTFRLIRFMDSSRSSIEKFNRSSQAAKHSSHQDMAIFIDLHDALIARNAPGQVIYARMTDLSDARTQAGHFK